MSSKWKVLHLVLNYAKDMSTSEMHRKVLKDGKYISRSTLYKWRKVVRSGGTMRPRFDTLEVVLSSVSTNSFAIVDSKDNVLVNFSKSPPKKTKKTSKTISRKTGYFVRYS